MTKPQDLTPASADQSVMVAEMEWPMVSRIVFRFVFTYVVLFLASWAAFFAPLTFPIAAVSQVVWEAVVPWVARHILLVPAPPLISDGDGLGHWIQLGCCVVLAVVVTLIWSIAGRQRKNYAKLHILLRVILRYALGIAMVTYGLFKIFHLQMLPPHLAKLVQPYGDSSPTSLLWIFMGSSAAYSAFTGGVEVLGGVLLFNRRTTTLGSLISLGALSHVVALNLSFDVSVKMWSMNLLAMTLVLVMPDFRRLVDVLVLNRPSVPVEFPPLFRNAKHNRIAFRIGMTCLAITFAFRGLGIANGNGQSYNRTPTVLYGIYDVESFTSNGTLLPPLLTDARRWRTVIIERSGMASIHLMNGVVHDYLTSVNIQTGTVTFIENPDTTVTTAGATRLAYNPRLIEDRFEQAIEANAGTGVTLDFSRPANHGIALSGHWESDSISVQLKRVDESKFLLLNRGFHWIQSYPFFR
ncbi:MAG: putative membrane protein YphA (DoxX/SURF4 family) [Mariniblastus sp.]